jgi:hypothetical protein
MNIGRKLHVSVSGYWIELHGHWRAEACGTRDAHQVGAAFLWNFSPHIASETRATEARAVRRESRRCAAARLRSSSGGAILPARASNGTHCDCVKRKKDRDQASAWQRHNLEIDVRADILDDGANPYGALLNKLFHGPTSRCEPASPLNLIRLVVLISCFVMNRLSAGCERLGVTSVAGFRCFDDTPRR